MIPARSIPRQIHRMIDTSVIRERFSAVGPELNERSRRRLAAAGQPVISIDTKKKELAGFVNLGIDNDTAQFSVNAIQCWLDVMRRERDPNMNQPMITTDGCGSNGSHVRLFKVGLQHLADETGPPQPGLA